jgi:cytidyltransferase-like protein
MTADSRPRQVVVAGAFDDLRAKQIRFLEEASKLGEVTALLWPDELARRVEGRGPKFPQVERAYFLQAIRFVRRVALVEKVEGGRQKAESTESLLEAAAEQAGVKPDLLVVTEAQESAAIRADCRARGIDYQVLREEDLRGLPEHAPEQADSASGRKKVLVTGCYDWVHSGHVRFFEEVSAYGELYVVVGHDANIRLLKGPGHPLFPQAERRYVVGAIRHVTQALVATGDGWVDAEPEMRRLKPDIYAVNEDGDRGGKREYCAKMGLEYLVLKRTPAPGLPPRTSTDLRGF